MCTERKERKKKMHMDRERERERGRERGRRQTYRQRMIQKKELEPAPPVDTGENAIVISGPLEDDLSYTFLRG